MKTRGRVALFLPNLGGGGAERVMVEVARGLARRGHDVDVVAAQLEGPFVAELPEQVRAIDLGAPRVMRAIPDLVRYLRRERPRVLLSTMNHANVAAIAAGVVARTGVPVVVREAGNLTYQRLDARSWRARIAPLASRAAYPWAHRVIAVSEAARRDLVEHVRLPLERVDVIYNPVDLDAVRAAAEAEVPRWPAVDGEPVVLAVGRLDVQKDHATLLRAFARLRCDARLLLLGEGPERAALERLSRDLGIAERVSMPGFVDNPFPYLQRATVVAHPSRWEGLPNVLIQAVALGAPVVATDCAGGSREILEDGRIGPLVPVGDVPALAAALDAALERGLTNVEPGPTWRARFEPEAVLDRYCEALGLR